MNQENLDISKMLTEVGHTANAVGVAQLTKMLKDIRKIQKELTKEEYELAIRVIEIVCETYDMTVDEFYSNKRKNNRRSALATVFFILYEIYKLNFEKICFITNKPFSLISVLIKEVKELDISHPIDKIVLNKLQIVKYKLEIN